MTQRPNNLVLFYEKTEFRNVEGEIPEMDIWAELFAFNDDAFAKTHGEAGVRAMAELVEKETRVAALERAGKSTEEAVLEVFGSPIDVPDIDLTKPVTWKKDVRGNE